MTIEKGFWKEIGNSRQQLSLKKIREVIKTDREDPCVAIDALLQYVQSYKACWAGKAKSGTITSFEPIVKSAIEKCVALDALFRNNGMRTIWCLDGDRNSNKLAADRRREKREGKRNDIFKLYCSIVALKEINRANDLQAFKRKYVIIEQNIPDDFPREDILDGRIEELENKLASDFKNEGFFPPNLVELITDGIRSKHSSLRFMRIPEISEGEKLGAILTQTGTAQAVYTTDGDAVVLGARYIIKEISAISKDRVVGEYHLYSHARITRDIGMNYKQLLTFAILLGNDFNIAVPGEGMVTCKKNAMSDSFDLVAHNIKNLGCLNLSVCVKELSVSQEDFDLVMNYLEQVSM